MLAIAHGVRALHRGDGTGHFPTISDVDAVTTHNPFAVSDIYFSQMTGYPLDRMNSYGCSLIFGHPRGRPVCAPLPSASKSYGCAAGASDC